MTDVHTERRSVQSEFPVMLMFVDLQDGHVGHSAEEEEE